VAHKGKIQLLYVIVSPAELEAEGDRIFHSHQAWMQSSHHRTGEKALLSYEVSKAPQLTNPMDASSAKTGKVCFILNEIYETEAGVAEHFRLAESGWKDFGALVEWLGKCTMVGSPAAKIFNSLW
jgi:hypothetical protein